MKFLLDQGLSPSTTQLLADAGLVAKHTSEIGLHRASDREILDYAAANLFIVVTLDGDHHAILAHESRSSPSVIRLRMQKLRAVETARLVRMIAERFADQLNRGVAITVAGTSIRIRPLPLSPKSSHE